MLPYADTDLAAIVEAWDRLTEGERKRVLAIVRAAMARGP
jgi:hypothetical protein